MTEFVAIIKAGEHSNCSNARQHNSLLLFIFARVVENDKWNYGTINGRSRYCKMISSALRVYRYPTLNTGITTVT